VNLPRVLQSQDHDNDKIIDFLLLRGSSENHCSLQNTRLHQNSMSQFGMDKNSGEESDRLRVFCTSDVTQSITSLGALPFWKAFWDIIKCRSLGIFQTSSLFLKYPSGHYTLWREGVKHSDITISNLTHRNGTGVFNDLDYSTTPRSRKFDRHGATTFLALDLINYGGIVQAERRYRHGLESLFWILLWISSCYDDNVRTIPASQRRWLDHDIVKSWSFRHAMLIQAEKIPISKSYQPLAGPIFLFRHYWIKYFAEERKKENDLFWMSVKNGHVDACGPTHSESAEDVERMLFTLLVAFEEPKVAERLERMGLVLDIPRTLFPNYAKLQSGVFRIESADSGANHCG
jgi:hypothetical protein